MDSDTKQDSSFCVYGGAGGLLRLGTGTRILFYKWRIVGKSVWRVTSIWKYLKDNTQVPVYTNAGETKRYVSTMVHWTDRTPVFWVFLLYGPNNTRDDGKVSSNDRVHNVKPPSQSSINFADGVA